MVQGAIIIGNHTVGLAGLGALALATNFAVFADRVDSIVRSTIYPAVCAVRDRTDLLLETFTKSNRLALMWAIPFGAGLALFADDLVAYVLGERWEEAAGLLAAFGLILATRQIAFNWIAFFTAVGDTKPMAVNGALQLAVFATVTAPLMIWLGLTGYAIGTSVERRGRDRPAGPLPEAPVRRLPPGASHRPGHRTQHPERGGRPLRASPDGCAAQRRAGRGRARPLCCHHGHLDVLL